MLASSYFDQLVGQEKLTPMAAGAVMYSFAVQLADVDRGVYEDVTLRAARHPSETDAYMMTRVLAYCLECVEGTPSATGSRRPTTSPPPP